MQLNSCTSILLLAQLLFQNGQISGEGPQAHSKPGPLQSSQKASYTVTYKNILNKTNLSSFKKTLDQLMPNYTLDIRIEMSNMDLFPVDFFQSYRVMALYLKDCSMSTFPYDLIDPICREELKFLAIYNSEMAKPALELNPGGFQNCTGLPEIWLENVLEEVPNDAFRGLDKLQALTLQENQIQRVDVGLEGLLDTVWYLNLGANPIRSIPKVTFEGWTKLTFLTLHNASISTLECGAFSSLGPNPSVILAGNPLNCTDLQWLQDWYKKNPIDEREYYARGFKGDPQPRCAIPCNIPLLSLDYKNYPYKCGAQQITSLGLLALLVIAIIPYNM